LFEPVGDLFEVGGTSAELADIGWQLGRVFGVGGSVAGRDGNPVYAGVNVDAGGVWFEDGKRADGWFAWRHGKLRDE
jgi:hypothetical protein